MNKLITAFLFLVLINLSSLYSQDRVSIFDEPLELNPQEWLNKFPHSFTPLTVDYEPDYTSDFANINISGETSPQNEPSVKISRVDPNRVIAAWRDFRTGVNPPLRRVGFSLSTDGGETWSVSQLLPQIIPGVPLNSDPVVGVDLSGNFYIYTVSLNETSGNGELWVYKSLDGGVTFNTVYLIANGPGFEDKEWANADLNPLSSFANRLYLSWTRFGASTEILLTKSTDEGVTWSIPVNVSDGSGGVQGSVPAVGPNGELYVVWRGFTGGNNNIFFDKSLDGGDTFSTDKIISSAPNAWFPSIDVDRSGGPRNGYIYVTWDDETNNDEDVWMSYSSNGGDTWSVKQRINNDPVNNGKDQFWPWIAVGDDGNIAIVFYDTRNTPNNNIIEAFIARSLDGGMTFTNELLSSEPSPTNIPNSDVRFGDYINIDYVGNHIVPVWTDERAGGFDMDIYTAYIDDIVPVELLSFTVSVVNGNTILEWSTASEKNNFGFEVQRSYDNLNFIAIGFKEGNGTTTETQNYTFTDISINKTVYYRLKQIDYNGTYSYSNVVEVNGVTIETIALEQNYPNPFNPATTINYQLGNAGFVNLKVFNSLGEEVAELTNEVKQGGSYSIQFDASDLPSGVYIYRLKSGKYTESKKMLLLR